MSFRPTLATLSKASRAPLTSKGGNKEFYKGTGSFPGLGRKHQGRQGSKTGSKAPYILEPERMRTFVVPANLNSTDLLPYVDRNAKISPEQDWPQAQTKGDDANSKRGGLYGPGGFDGAYYLQLAEFYENKAKP